MLRICIVGGGSLAHVCAGELATRPEVEVSVLTRRPEFWCQTLRITHPNGDVFSGTLACVTAEPAAALRDCNIALLCLPGYAIEDTLQRIAPHLTPQTIVGSIVSSTGFFFAAHRQLPSATPIFGFQRVPYIARTTTYGAAANLLGYKPSLAIAVEGNTDAEALRRCVEELWQTPTKLLASHYEASLTNSNPILHTARLYSLWHDWDGQPLPSQTLFYSEWTDKTSELLIAMDAEFMQLLEALGVTPGAVPPLLEYYESHDAPSLTRKIRSIAAFRNILAPMVAVEGGWEPDFTNRYFTEDFPYGLSHIVRLAEEHAIEAPHLRCVYDWGMSKVKQRA